MLDVVRVKGGKLSSLASYANAREMEAAFLRTGKIAVSQFEGLIKVVKNYAATTGTGANGPT